MSRSANAPRGMLLCPLCGFEFEEVDTVCRHGCPMRVSCGSIRCPSCDYEFAEQPKSVSWLKRLLHRPPPQAPCEHLSSLNDLGNGDSGTLRHVGGRLSRKNTLAVFGLTEGAEVTLLQRYPACVVQVGETELALDAEIARELLVERAEA